MNNSLFSMLTPKENKFYSLLNQMSEVIVILADLAEECIYKARTHKDIMEYLQKIREHRKMSSALQNNIFTELHKTFVTPFDREDINHLAVYMKDTVDYITACAKKIMLYEPKEIPEAAEVLVKLVKNSADFLDKAIKELIYLKKDAQKISQYCAELNKIEGQADDVYERFLIDLFKNEKDAIELVKLKDILHELEMATDAADHVGKIIKTIIVKYA